MAISRIYISALLLSASLSGCAASQYELNSGDIIDISSPADIIDTLPGEKGGAPSQKRAVSPRDLFGRQYCSAPGQNVICGTGCCPNADFCCERSTCIDLTFKICCIGGIQCPKGGDCCLDGRCCPANQYCVRNLDTNSIGCRSGSSGNTQLPPNPSTITYATTPPPAVATPTNTGTFSCFDSGYLPCRGASFCCPSTASYCFYNERGASRCNAGPYYTYTYTYSYSFTYYTTYTTFYLGGAPTVVPSFATPTPPTTPPRTASTAATTAANTGVTAVGPAGIGGGSSSSSSSSSSSRVSAAGSAPTASATAAGASGATAVRAEGLISGAGGVAMAIVLVCFAGMVM